MPKFINSAKQFSFDQDKLRIIVSLNLIANEEKELKEFGKTSSLVIVYGRKTTIVVSLLFLDK
mgnify:CR=1 FL=1